MFMIAENATHYEEGDLTAVEAADNSVELFYMLVDAGMFERGEDDHDHHGDDPNGDEPGLHHHGDEDYHHQHGDSDTSSHADYDRHHDHDVNHGDHDGQAGGPNGEEVDWNTFSYCEWEGADWADDTMWYCDEDGDKMDFEDYWYYCELETDPNYMWYCTDDFGQSSDYQNSMDNTHHADGTMPERNHGDNDDEHHDEDDNPALLDGIVGVNDPEDAEPMPMAENMIGALSVNEGLPMMMGTNFKIHFEGVDASLETHEVYIPIDGDGSGTVWHVEMTLLEGYEVISCEKCEDLEIDGNRAKFHSNEPVMVMFGKAATTEECDQTVTIGEGGYSFEPAEITISVGDTVCWIWENTADVHNVIAVTDLDSLVNLESGFNSGEPSQTVDFRYTFTEDSMTYYYVCEPHATMGMVGTVTVGTGSEDDRIPEIIDDSGLPSVSFVVGALVLVGAAGLRRRIH